LAKFVNNAERSACQSFFQQFRKKQNRPFFFFGFFIRVFKQAEINFIFFKALPDPKSVTFSLSDLRIFHPASEYLIRFGFGDEDRIRSGIFADIAAKISEEFFCIKFVFFPG
jgi:hypothetical protein